MDGFFRRNIGKYRWYESNHIYVIITTGICFICIAKLMT